MLNGAAARCGFLVCSTCEGHVGRPEAPYQTRGVRQYAGEPFCCSPEARGRAELRIKATYETWAARRAVLRRAARLRRRFRFVSGTEVEIADFLDPERCILPSLHIAVRTTFAAARDPRRASAWWFAVGTALESEGELEQGAAGLASELVVS